MAALTRRDALVSVSATSRALTAAGDLADNYWLRGQLKVETSFILSDAQADLKRQDCKHKRANGQA